MCRMNARRGGHRGIMQRSTGDLAPRTIHGAQLAVKPRWTISWQLVPSKTALPTKPHDRSVQDMGVSAGLREIDGWEWVTTAYPSIARVVALCTISTIRLICWCKPTGIVRSA